MDYLPLVLNGTIGTINDYRGRLKRNYYPSREAGHGASETKVGFRYEHQSLRIAKAAQIEANGTKFYRARMVGAGRGCHVLFRLGHLAADAFSVASAAN